MQNIGVRLITDQEECSTTTQALELFGLPRIKHLRGLHAKIYILDGIALITSANLTETAFTKRHEVGIFLNSDAIKEMVAIFEKWWESSPAVDINKVTQRNNHANKNEEPGNNSAPLPKLWNLPNVPINTHTTDVYNPPRNNHIKEELLHNRPSIQFNFTVNQSFLRYRPHPITVPRGTVDYALLRYLQQNHQISIIYNETPLIAGVMYHGIAGRGPYYQIRMTNAYPNHPLFQLPINR